MRVGIFNTFAFFVCWEDLWQTKRFEKCVKSIIDHVGKPTQEFMGSNHALILYEKPLPKICSFVSKSYSKETKPSNTNTPFAKIVKKCLKQGTNFDIGQKNDCDSSVTFLLCYPNFAGRRRIIRFFETIEVKTKLRVVQ